MKGANNENTSIYIISALEKSEVVSPATLFHDPMLILSMSIFNCGRSWEQIFNPIPQRENVWARTTAQGTPLQKSHEDSQV